MITMSALASIIAMILGFLIQTSHQLCPDDATFPLNIGGTAGDTYIQQVSIKLSKVIVKRLLSHGD
jgi:hypothetical protein